MSLSDFTKSLVTNLGERSVPERSNLQCLKPKAEFASPRERVIDRSEIPFIKRTVYNSIYHEIVYTSYIVSIFAGK